MDLTVCKTEPISNSDITSITGQTDRWDRDRNNDGPRERTPYVDTTSDDWRRDVKPQDDSGPAPYQ